MKLWSSVWCLVFLTHGVSYVEERSHAETELDSSSSFDKTPACDKQTQTDTGPLLQYCASPASRGGVVKHHGVHYVQNFPLAYGNCDLKA